MKIELHIIQNFAPSCLNRDDTNAPKDCDFGGYRRARISSQCLKRAIRTSSIFQNMLEGKLGVRTKKLVQCLSDGLQKYGLEQEKVQKVVSRFTNEYVGLESNGKTKVLLYLGADEIEKIVTALKANWDALLAAVDFEVDEKDKKGKKAQGDVFANLAKEVAKEAIGITKAVDIALFGRMVAESPKDKVDGVTQVAHAFSTHRVNMEMDFFTAIDDISNETGAEMMGTVEFNSACFYRYSLLDFQELINNLQNDKELALLTVEAFLRAAIEAIPSGKQTSMAAQNLPSCVFAVVRKNGAPQSLANGFERPVHPDSKKGIVIQSIENLDKYWGRLSRMYGQEGVLTRPICLIDDAVLENLGDQMVNNIEQLIGNVKEALA